MSSMRECHVCSSMQPRLITHASAAALSTTANTVAVPARKLHELLPDVVRVRRDALLVEEVALDAVRVALHVERPSSQMRQRAFGDAEVIGDEVALGEAALGKERLVRVRDPDVVAADLHPISLAPDPLEPIGYPVPAKRREKWPSG